MSEAPKKLKGWCIPGAGFIDFKEPVTFDEAKLAMEEMQKLLSQKRMADAAKKAKEAPND